MCPFLVSDYQFFNFFLYLTTLTSLAGNGVKYPVADTRLTRVLGYFHCTDTIRLIYISAVGSLVTHRKSLSFVCFELLSLL